MKDATYLPTLSIRPDEVFYPSPVMPPEPVGQVYVVSLQPLATLPAEGLAGQANQAGMAVGLVTPEGVKWVKADAQAHDYLASVLIEEKIETGVWLYVQIIPLVTLDFLQRHMGLTLRERGGE